MTKCNARHWALQNGSALLLVSVGGVLAYAPGARAQAPGQVTIDAKRCLELESPDARLACYESQVNKALDAEKDAQTRVSQPAPSQGAPSAAEAKARAEVDVDESAPAATATRSAPSASKSPAAAPADRAERPSAAASRAQRRAKARKDRAEEQTEVVGTIAALREREPNQLVITLEDGQVWLQTAPERYPLRVGREVRIRSSHWGEMYRLTDDDLRGFILVKRVQ